MEDRYFDHIVGCLRDAHERADNGWVKVTDDLVFRSMYLLKEQQARIERMEAERTPSVVTLDVIQGRKLDALWLEHRIAGSHPFDPTAVEPAIYYCMDIQGNMFFSCGCGTLRFDSDDYGWYWRCWTARPSEEMKKEVKWQEPADEWDGDDDG